VYFLLLIWKNAGKSAYVNTQLIYFFQSGGVQNFPHRLFLCLNGHYSALQGHILYCMQVHMPGIRCLRGFMALRLTYLR